MKKLRVGFIGTGDIFKNHYQTLINNEFATLVAVCSLERLELQNINHYFDYLEMINKEQLDVIHILTPHYLHFSQIEEISKHNINILVEKPIVMNMTEGKKLLELDTNVKIGCIYQNRYNPTTIKLKSLIDNKMYGSIIGIKGVLTWSRSQNYYDSKPWRKKMSEAGSGVLINQAIHTLDLIQYFGGEVISVKANMFNITDLDVEIEDTAVINLTFKDNVKGLLIATNGYVDNSSVEFEIVVEKGILNIKNHKLYFIDKENNSLLLESDPLPKNTKIYYGDSHKTAINSFYNSVINSDDNYVMIKEALVAIEIIDLAKKSTEFKNS